MATHEELWRIVKKMPSDFQPYGERDRDTADPSADCSCGCRHFVKLDGQLGYDWGVCANPASPRRGLLTFEHMGCPEFESEEDETEAMEQPSEAMEAADPRSAAPLQTLNIEWWELDLALESQLYGEISHYLDRQTGKIHTLSSDCGEDDELREGIESDSGERYLRLEPLESRESFRIMEHFASSLPESPARARLFDALSRKKPFRHFKDAVHTDVALRDQWFRFQNVAREQYARDWLEAHGIEADFVRPG